MNRKKILGITALLALVAMCLAFAACKVDDEERSVTFINKLGIAVDITFQGLAPVHLDPITLATTPATSRATVSTKGKDIVLLTISFDDATVEASPNSYVMLDGDLVGGKGKRKKDAEGVALSSGTLTFYPDPSQDNNANPAAPKGKVNVVQLDD